MQLSCFMLSVWDLQPIELSLHASLFLFFLLVLLAILLASCLGGQGAHGVANGLVVWVHTWEILQDTLKELWVLHHIIVILLLNKNTMR